MTSDIKKPIGAKLGTKHCRELEAELEQEKVLNAYFMLCLVMLLVVVAALCFCRYYGWI